MNRVERVGKNQAEGYFPINKIIITADYGVCITSEPLKATKLKKNGRYSSLNKIKAFSFTTGRKVNIAKGTTFCLR